MKETPRCSSFQTEVEMLPETPVRKGIVTELRASEVRWFYRGAGDDNQKWVPFNGTYHCRFANKS